MKRKKKKHDHIWLYMALSSKQNRTGYRVHQCYQFSGVENSEPPDPPGDAAAPRARPRATDQERGCHHDFN